MATISLAHSCSQQWSAILGGRYRLLIAVIILTKGAKQ